MWSRRRLSEVLRRNQRGHRSNVAFGRGCSEVEEGYGERRQEATDTTDDGVLAAQNAFPDVGSMIIVRRHEVLEVARSVGVDEEDAWRFLMR